MNPPIEQNEILGDGNTNPPKISKKKNICTQSKYLFFTFNNYTEKDITLIRDILEPKCISYVFQEETGEQGTKHLQGFIHLIKKSRETDLGLPKEIHFERVRNIKAAEAYCFKDSTRTGNIYRYPEPIKIIENLYEWQYTLETLLLSPTDDRSIMWIYEETGNTGKSAFVKYMTVKHNSLFLDGGEKRDIINLVFNSNMNKKNNIVLFDLCRSKQSKISYSALESIKNGVICNLKYETGFKVFNPPHIAIFSNSEPDYLQLSLDRWIIYSIKNLQLIQQLKI